MKNKIKREKLNIGVVTPILMKSGVVPTLNILNILESLADDLHVIEVDADGNLPNTSRENKRIHIYNGIKHRTGSNIFTRIGNFICIQVRISYRLLRVSKNVDLWIFYGGGSPLSILTAKLLRKKVIVLVAGRVSISCKKTHKKRLSAILSVLERANFYLADQIVVEFDDATDFLGLNKYRKKLSSNCTIYINFDLFNVKKDFKDRRNLIGYTGRLSPEKGVMNFVKAIPLILKERGDLEFLIGGDGSLFKEINNELKNNELHNKVKLTGWIPHDELPKYLNELKLIVAPSYTEGGIPTIIKEAMACGTLILVTPIAGGIDIIKDGETGFILANNSPECIAENVIRILEHTELEKIVNNARNLVEEEFSYEKEVKQYRNMLYGVL